MRTIPESETIEELSVQESRDRIQINEVGIRLLFGIAITSFFACVLAFLANHFTGVGSGSNGAIAGMTLASIIIYLLQKRRIKLALIMILWGFAFIPILFGFRAFGFNAPGVVCVPIAIMAASWALSVRHAVLMTVSVCAAYIFYYVLIRTGVVMPAQPNLLGHLLILLGVTVVALLMGLVGVRALRLEFTRVRQLANSLEVKAQALNRSEASFSALFLSNPLPSISGDIDGRLIDVNHAFIDDFAYSREQVLDQTVTSLQIFVDDRERKLVAKRTLGKGVVGHPAMLRLANGEIRSFLVSTSSFELSGGWRFVATFLDQTDRLEAEKAQHILNVELEQRVATRTAELSDALQSLQQTQSELVQSEKLASLGSLVAGIAHELNTPVGNALMVSSALVDQQAHFEAALDGGLSRSALSHFLSNIRDSADILTRNLRRTADLINSFKQVAVDQTSEQRRKFQLHEVAHEVLVTLSPTLRKTSHHMVNQIPEGILMDSFPGPLEQVLMNLTTNSLRHAFEGRQHGQISLRAELISSDWVCIHFADDGVGISEQNLQKIFDPFFTTKLGQGGSGLGLSIAYNIVTGMLGGRIEVVSELGKGAEFKIELPLTAGQDQTVKMES